MYPISADGVRLHLVAGQPVNKRARAILKDSSSTTSMMGIGMKEVLRLLRAFSSQAIHSLPFTGSVKRKHAPPLEWFSAQIRPP